MRSAATPPSSPSCSRSPPGVAVDIELKEDCYAAGLLSCAVDGGLQSFVWTVNAFTCA